MAVEFFLLKAAVSQKNFFSLFMPKNLSNNLSLYCFSIPHFPQHMIALNAHILSFALLNTSFSKATRNKASVRASGYKKVVFSEVVLKDLTAGNFFLS